MHYFKKTALVILYLLLLTCTLSSYAAIQVERIWTGFDWIGAFNFNERLLYHLEFQARISPHDSLTRRTFYEDSLARVALGYQTTSNTSMWFGYMVLPSISDNKGGLSSEQRLWQQFLWRPISNDRYTLVSRTRLEQRKRQGMSQVAIRLRERLSLQLNHLLFNKFTPIIADEVFLHVNPTNWTPRDSFDQNRFFIGVLFPLTKGVDLEVGYLNQLAIRTPRNNMAHVLVMMFKF